METTKGRISRLQREQSNINYAKRIAKKILNYNDYKTAVKSGLCYQNIRTLAKVFLKEITST